MVWAFLFMETDVMRWFCPVVRLSGALQTPGQCEIFLHTTYLFSGLLSAACLLGQQHHRKRGRFKCGDDYICIIGYELGSRL